MEHGTFKTKGKALARDNEHTQPAEAHQLHTPPKSDSLGSSSGKTTRWKVVSKGQSRGHEFEEESPLKMPTSFAAIDERTRLSSQVKEEVDPVYGVHLKSVFESVPALILCTPTARQPASLLPRPIGHVDFGQPSKNKNLTALESGQNTAIHGGVHYPTLNQIETKVAMGAMMNNPYTGSASKSSRNPPSKSFPAHSSSFPNLDHQLNTSHSKSPRNRWLNKRNNRRPRYQGRREGTPPLVRKANREYETSRNRRPYSQFQVSKARPLRQFGPPPGLNVAAAFHETDGRQDHARRKFQHNGPRCIQEILPANFSGSVARHDAGPSCSVGQSCQTSTRQALSSNHLESAVPPLRAPLSIPPPPFTPRPQLIRYELDLPHGAPSCSAPHVDSPPKHSPNNSCGDAEEILGDEPQSTRKGIEWRKNNKKGTRRDRRGAEQVGAVSEVGDGKEDVFPVPDSKTYDGKNDSSKDVTSLDLSTVEPLPLPVAASVETPTKKRKKKSNKSTPVFDGDGEKGKDDVKKKKRSRRGVKLAVTEGDVVGEEDDALSLPGSKTPSHNRRTASVDSSAVETPKKDKKSKRNTRESASGDTKTNLDTSPRICAMPSTCSRENLVSDSQIASLSSLSNATPTGDAKEDKGKSIDRGEKSSKKRKRQPETPLPACPDDDLSPFALTPLSKKGRLSQPAEGNNAYAVPDSPSPSGHRQASSSSHIGSQGNVCSSIRSGSHSGHGSSTKSKGNELASSLKNVRSRSQRPSPTNTSSSWGSLPSTGRRASRCSRRHTSHASSGIHTPPSASPAQSSNLFVTPDTQEKARGPWYYRKQSTDHWEPRASGSNHTGEYTYSSRAGPAFPRPDQRASTVKSDYRFLHSSPAGQVNILRQKHRKLDQKHEELVKEIAELRKLNS